MSKTAERNTETHPAVPAPSFYGTDAASAEWRSRQAHVDADIEGLARDPVAERMVADWRKAGLSSAEQRARLIAHYRTEDGTAPLAAE